MSNLLFGVGPEDLVTYVVVAATLLITCAVAAFIPARNAAKVDPKLALNDA